ncbi:GNAT family N-acetyltransferase [Ensifer sp.]|jgi:diamine N-acetyltransferase|uniref:GNAT family N-acetyltransferase n=1 Tax=Ensifer sp. TaxID=1872086 RepID=UPI002E12DD2A|nr:GNAT family N-acetyltransferase [Ensifer sp.]
MTETVLPPDAEITLRRISALTVCDVCELSDTLSEEQRNMVADNGTSIGEAHFSENAWFRAVYADETLIGFIMLHQGSDWDDGIDCPGVYLWRFMIAGPFQGKGFGRQAIALVVRDLKARGLRELYTSYGQGPGSPEGFYHGLGFKPTGEYYDDEHEAVLKF